MFFFNVTQTLTKEESEQNSILIVETHNTRGMVLFEEESEHVDASSPHSHPVKEGRPVTVTQ